MVDALRLIVNSLKGNVRVNTANNTVEIFNEYGTKMVLRDLDSATLEAFKNEFQNF